jgi:hypothetical protein
MLGNYFGELSINYCTNFSKGEDTANNNLANITSAHLVNMSEVEIADNEGQKFLTNKLKILSGGDTVTCRRSYCCNELSFKAGNLWIQTNIMPTFSGKNTDNVSLKERIEILEFPFSYVDYDDLNDSNPERFKKRKAMFHTPVYGYAMFQLLLSQVPMVLGTDIAYPFKVKMAKLRFFDAVGDELGKWFEAYYYLEDVVEGRELTVLNLKVVMLTAVGAFNHAIIRMCSKLVDGSAGYFSNDNMFLLMILLMLLNLLLMQW